MAKNACGNWIWWLVAALALGLAVWAITASTSKPQPQQGSYLAMNAVPATEHQLIAHTACAQLGIQQPSALPLCHTLFPQGRYPLPRGIAEQPKLIPKNFADQYAADEPITALPANWNQKSHGWTLDLEDTDNKGFSSAAHYQSYNRTPSWRETWYRPGALENPRTYLNDNLRVRPRVPENLVKQ